MARPSRKDVRLREEIIGLGLFVRDSEFYMGFESETKNDKVYQLSYAFCGACYIRKLGNDRAENLDKHFIENIVFDTMKKYISDNEIEIFNQLELLNKQLYCLIIHNLMGSKSNYAWRDDRGYSIHNIVETNDFGELVGKDRAEEFKHYFSDIPFCSLDEYSSTELTKEEEELIKKSELKHITLIKRSTIFPEIEQYVEKHRLTYTELDFTKPLNELIDFVTKIKNDFDKNRRAITTLHDLCSYTNLDKLFQCDLEDCDIYKTNYTKPISGRLADVLFIYDCKKVNEILGADIFTMDYIQSEINRYWQDVKNLFPKGSDKIQEETVLEYYELAKDYIDNEKYKCYLSGYDLTTEK